MACGKYISDEGLQKIYRYMTMMMDEACDTENNIKKMETWHMENDFIQYTSRKLKSKWLKDDSKVI